MAIMLVWVRLMGLPAHMWNTQSFTNIGNTLKIFLVANYSYKETKDFMVVKIIINLDLT